MDDSFDWDTDCAAAQLQAMFDAPFHPEGAEAVKMYSFDRPAYMFWRGALEALKAAGKTESEAFEWLRSKQPRWMLDKFDGIIEQAGKDITAEWLGS